MSVGAIAGASVSVGSTTVTDVLVAFGTVGVGIDVEVRRIATGCAVAVAVALLGVLCTACRAAKPPHSIRARASTPSTTHCQAGRLRFMFNGVVA